MAAQEFKTLTDAQIQDLKKPLPKEAVKPHPTKGYMSTIKVPFMVERLNDVFGVNGWFDDYQIVENPQAKAIGDGPKERPGMIVVRGELHVPEFGIKRTAFGGNDNVDRGDAYKGACTDALSKMCSMLYIGMDVYKGLKEGEVQQTEKANPNEPEQIASVLESVKSDDQGRIWFKLTNGYAYCNSDDEVEELDKLMNASGKRVTLWVWKEGKMRGCPLYKLAACIKVEDAPKLGDLPLDAKEESNRRAEGRSNPRRFLRQVVQQGFR
jgi:hypothetical protein